jgi:hypothetical protein
METNENPREANFERAHWTRVVMKQRTELLREKIPEPWRTLQIIQAR